MVLEYRLDISKLQLSQAISQDGVLETKKQVVKKRKKYRIPMNCTPFVIQYDILDNKWGALLWQKGYQTNATHQNSRRW